MSRKEVVRLIIQSPEGQSMAQTRAESSTSSTPPQYLTPQSSDQFKAERINALYQATPRPSGRSPRTSVLHDLVDNGANARDIIIDILGSDEYYSDITDALQAKSSS